MSLYRLTNDSLIIHVSVKSNFWWTVSNSWGQAKKKFHFLKCSMRDFTLCGSMKCLPLKDLRKLKHFISSSCFTSMLFNKKCLKFLKSNISMPFIIMESPFEIWNKECVEIFRAAGLSQLPGGSRLRCLRKNNIIKGDVIVQEVHPLANQIKDCVK